MTKILEGNIIKKANAKQRYTKEQIAELRKCSATNEDGHYYFMENFGHLKHTSRGRVLFKAFDYQRRLIDNYHNYRFSINMLGRQMGKCVSGDSTITVRNKRTGEVKEVSFEDFFDTVNNK